MKYYGTPINNLLKYNGPPYFITPGFDFCARSTAISFCIDLDCAISTQNQNVPPPAAC